LKIFITGSGGFVGKAISEYFNNHELIIHKRTQQFNINCEVVINCAGKAHDLKNVTSPEEYYQVNTDLTKKLFDAFLNSNAKVFITISSVKAVADKVEGELTEEVPPNPKTHYGKSKLLAEQYILSKHIPEGKKIYILRPCIIHGPGNKGNLNLLYSLVSSGIPWPLGLFKNNRSFLSIENLCFVIKELIERDDIISGVYNVSDDDTLSTNEMIKLISESKSKRIRILKFNKNLIKIIACIGDKLNLPINSDRLQKLTESYVVSNAKIKSALGKPLPVTSKEGLLRTFNSFLKIH
jgi:nucleoside-diphosphate-sugar epimerase